jgi:predicted ribosome quality control (RQC) complex YloA/Tae2 family protein
VVNSSGQLGVAVSSERFKDEIKRMDKASEAILALRPVTFRYKKDIDPDRTPQFGLVAEEVAKVNPDLVARDADGKVYTVRYDAVNAMVLNEFLKEHRKVEELKTAVLQQQKGFQATIAQQQKDFQSTATQQQNEIEALTAGLNEQAWQIQKVSAQLAAASPSSGGLEVTKFATGRIRRGGPAPQIALNNQ